MQIHRQDAPAPKDIPFVVLYFVLPVTATILLILAFEFPDIATATAITSVGCFLIFLGKRSVKFKMISFSFGIFILLHLVLFPLIYLSIIKSDIRSFAIEQQILQNERISAEHSVNEQLIPIQLEMKYLMILLASPKKSLSHSTRYLYEDNLVHADNLILFRTMEFVKSPAGPMYNSRLSIAKINGKKILTFKNLKIEDSETSIKNTLLNYYQKISIKSSAFNKELESIKIYDMWTYLRLLPFAINIYDTGNMNPIAKSANIIYAIHKMLVPLLVLGILCGAAYDLVNYSD